MQGSVAKILISNILVELTYREKKIDPSKLNTTGRTRAPFVSVEHAGEAKTCGVEVKKEEGKK